MKKTKINSGFSLLELIIALIVISIISSMIYGAYNSMRDVDRKSNLIKEVETLKKQMNQRLKDIEVLEGTLISSDTIYYKQDKIMKKFELTTFDDKDDDTFSNISEPKKKFWDIGKSRSKIYIFPEQKYFINSLGKIPYMDFHVILLGSKIDRAYNGDLEAMMEDLFLFNNDKDNPDDNENFKANLNQDFNDPEAYKNIKASKLNKETIREEIKNIVVFKVSTQDIVLEKFKKTIASVEGFAKNLKDWSSIQMSMYENIVAKYGGSYNIGYFVSLGLDSSDINSGYSGPNNDFKKYQTSMVFSSFLLDTSNAPIRKLEGSNGNKKEGLMDIKSNEHSSTKYGIVICQANDCGKGKSVSDRDIISMNSLEFDLNSGKEEKELKLPPQISLTVEKAINIDSKGLLDGSKNIMGIGNPDLKFGNEFGEKYKYFLSNSAEWNLRWDTDDEGGGKELKFKQNVPIKGAYAPYSATIFTIFPWFLQGMDAKGDDDDISNGYHEFRVYPELR